MSAFDEAEAATSSGPRGGGSAGGRILRPVAVRPTGPPSSINSTGSASGGGLYEAQVTAISQSLRDLANLQPATRRQVDQIGTRLDTVELRTKMYGCSVWFETCLLDVPLALGVLCAAKLLSPSAPSMLGRHLARLNSLQRRRVARASRATATRALGGHSSRSSVWTSKRCATRPSPPCAPSLPPALCCSSRRRSPTWTRSPSQRCCFTRSQRPLQQRRHHVPPPLTTAIAGAVAPARVALRLLPRTTRYCEPQQEEEEVEGCWQCGVLHG